MNLSIVYLRKNQRYEKFPKSGIEDDKALELLKQPGLKLPVHSSGGCFLGMWYLNN